MLRRIIAPAAYAQGRGVLADAESFSTLRGGSAFVLGGETALTTCEDRLIAGLNECDIDVTAVEKGVDSCTFAVIEQLVERVNANEADTVVGVGGGVALDTAKAVAERSDTELLVVPTIASTDAPCSSVSVVYDEEGKFDGYVQRHRNPDLVLVDTEVIARSPVRFLRYGMGDALATRFEVETVTRSYAETHAGGVATDSAVVLARRCFENIKSDGAEAIAAVENDSVTPAVERIVETNTLLSGLGFESGGLAAAHAFQKGFTRAGVKAPHGQIVAFSTIAQLVMEDRPSEPVHEVVSVASEVGITPTLSELGAAPDDVYAIARHSCADDTTMSNEPFEVKPEMAADAIRTADEILSEE